MKNWYLRLSDATRAGINTAWQSAAGAFLLMLLGFLDDIKEWVDDPTGEFPSVSPYGKGAASILLGLVTGVLVAVYRHFKPGPVYPNGPAHEGDDRGDIGLMEIVLILFAVCAIVWLVKVL